MPARFIAKLDHLLGRRFPERRVFLKSDDDTRFVRLRPSLQLVALTTGAGVVAWTIFATAVLLMDAISAGNLRERTIRDHQTYEERLTVIAEERDAKIREAIAAQSRFNSALDHISLMQSQLLALESRQRELEAGIDVIQSTLRREIKAHQNARDTIASLQDSTVTSPITRSQPNAQTTVGEILSSALTKTASERDRSAKKAMAANSRADELEFDLTLSQEKNNQILRQIEEAVTITLVPLEKMFLNAGLEPDRIIELVRRGYSGKGGPLVSDITPVLGEDGQLLSPRNTDLLAQIDRLNLFAIASTLVPFAMPVKGVFRHTSGFGFRRDPKTGRRRMHNGIDLAAAYGSDILATADGVVTAVGWRSGFGKLVRIRHDFGIETLYAHNSNILVKKGQKVSRGDHIADMGNTGRSTGTHLHYEIRVGGKPINPMTYIKAANDVFKK